MKRRKCLKVLAITLVMSGFILLTTSQLGFAVDKGYANPQMLISAKELKTKLDQGKDISIIDVTNKINYTKGHIPNAVSIWGSEMAISKTIKGETVKGLRLNPKGFEKLMSQKGIENNSYVVLYDHSGGLWAARVWWMLKLYGHEGKVQLLDGGFKTWNKADYDVAHFGSNVEETNYKVKVINDQFVISTTEVYKKLDDPNFIMIDTRSNAEYKGEKTFGGANRKGHIPGAVHIEWNKTLNKDGTLKSGMELKKLYQSNGITPSKEIAMHCHTAVRSAHTFFTLRLIGYPVLRNYDESWVGWANDSSLPIK